MGPCRRPRSAKLSYHVFQARLHRAGVGRGWVGWFPALPSTRCYLLQNTPGSSSAVTLQLVLQGLAHPPLPAPDPELGTPELLGSQFGHHSSWTYFVQFLGSSPLSRVLSIWRLRSTRTNPSSHTRWLGLHSTSAIRIGRAQAPFFGGGGVPEGKF